MESICYRVVVKHKTMFSSGIGHSGAHCCKLRTTFGFSRTDNCNKIYSCLFGFAFFGQLPFWQRQLPFWFSIFAFLALIRADWYDILWYEICLSGSKKNRLVRDSSDQEWEQQLASKPQRAQRQIRSEMVKSIHRLSRRTKA